MGNEGACNTADDQLLGKAKASGKKLRLEVLCPIVSNASDENHFGRFMQTVLLESPG